MIYDIPVSQIKVTAKNGTVYDCYVHDSEFEFAKNWNESIYKLHFSGWDEFTDEDCDAYRKYINIFILVPPNQDMYLMLGCIKDLMEKTTHFGDYECLDSIDKIS